MSDTKNQNETMSLTVMEGLTVTILPSLTHEFLMTSKEVANGYGSSKYAVFKTLNRHSGEMIEGKHFLRGVDKMSTPSIQPNSILWTKRGIVRLGFFIKSERAKLFRDWAEELIIKVDEQKNLFGEPMPRMLPKKTKANRLTHERLLDIMADVCRIDDRELRIAISAKLMKGGI